MTQQDHHDYESVLRRIQEDERYQRNLDWGQPRRGHPEGTVRAHIEELEQNLSRLPTRDATQHAQLRVLIHTHDSFKADAKRGVSITDPRSHASLARKFLAEFCDDPSMLTIVQYHDEPYALWKQENLRGGCNEDRFENLLSVITDWDLFLRFLIIDGCTEGKGRQPLQWFLPIVAGRVGSSVTVDNLL